MTKQDSGRVVAVSMVHLFSKSLASPERCMCEKEVIRTAAHPLLIVVEELRELSRFSAGLLT